jgi:GTP-binding protein
MDEQPPRSHEGGTGRVYYATQTGVAPPVIVLSVNDPAVFARHYLRFLNNRLRATYGFVGSRIFIKLKAH